MIFDEEDKILEFRNMCRRHDYTYDMSDTHYIYLDGRRSKEEIIAFATQYLSKSKADEIWDEIALSKLGGDSSENAWVGGLYRLD